MIKVTFCVNGSLPQLIHTFKQYENNDTDDSCKQGFTVSCSSYITILNKQGLTMLNKESMTQCT